MQENHAWSATYDSNGEDARNTARHVSASGSRVRSAMPSVDMAIAAWLSAKERVSASQKTRAAYAAAMSGFRVLLQSQEFDLDAADPRRIRADLDAVSNRDGAIDAEEVEHLQAERVRLLSIAAEAFATRPAQTRYGPRPVKAATINLRLAALSSFYSFALSRDFLRGLNPITRVARQTVHGYEAAVPLHYEVLRERLALIDRKSPAGQRDYALLLLGLHTGRRLSELAGMCREHLVIRNTSVEITWPRCKGNKQMRDILPRGGAHGIAADALITWVETRAEMMKRQQHTQQDTAEPAGNVPAQLMDVMARHQNETRLNRQLPFTQRAAQQYLWISLANNGTFGHALNLSSISDICERRLGTSKVHSLRHTFARALEDAGVKVSEIQAHLGHESLQTTGRYLARLHQGEHHHLASLSALYGLAASGTPDTPAPDRIDTDESCLEPDETRR